MEPIHIKLSDSVSVVINFSGGEPKYRYDIYDNNRIIGVMGMDIIVEDTDILEVAIWRYFNQLGIEVW